MILLVLQKMGIISEKLWATVTFFPNELSVEVKERERFREELQAVFTKQPVSYSELDRILSCEIERRSAVVHSRKMTLQVMSVLAELASQHRTACLN